MTTRVTKTDWKIINEALAMFEATEDDDGRPNSFWVRVRKTRHKVWERLDASPKKAGGR